MSPASAVAMVVAHLPSDRSLAVCSNGEQTVEGGAHARPSWVKDPNRQWPPPGRFMYAGAPPGDGRREASSLTGKHKAWNGLLG